MSSYKSAMKELQAQGDEKASKRAKLILQWSKIEVLVLICLVASECGSGLHPKWNASTILIVLPIRNIDNSSTAALVSSKEDSGRPKGITLFERSCLVTVRLSKLTWEATEWAWPAVEERSSAAWWGTLSLLVKELTEPENCCSSCLTVKTRSLSCERHLSTLAATLADTLEGNSFIPSTKDWIVQVFLSSFSETGSSFRVGSLMNSLASQ